ncbi:type I methionyl aminopeptidase, partial [Enterococcus faecalis]
MITLKSPREIEMIDESGELLAEVLRHLRTFIKPGITSWEIEEFVRAFIESHG